MGGSDGGGGGGCRGRALAGNKGAISKRVDDAVEGAGNRITVVGHPEKPTDRTSDSWSGISSSILLNDSGKHRRGVGTRNGVVGEHQGLANLIATGHSLVGGATGLEDSVEGLCLERALIFTDYRKIVDPVEADALQ